MNEPKVTFKSLEGRYQDFCQIARELVQTTSWDQEYGNDK